MGRSIEKPVRLSASPDVSANIDGKKKVLISFMSPDQDDWEFKKNDPAFKKSFEKPPKDRHGIWRPSVALAQLKDLAFDEYYLLWDGASKHRRIKDEISRDIEDVIKSSGRNTRLHVEDMDVKKPFETSEVYPKLFKLLSRPEFQDPCSEYYVNCTSGTTQMRNCLFLLTHTGHIKAYRIAPTPWIDYKVRDHRCVQGSYALEDPAEFGKAYEAIDGKTPGNRIGRSLLKGVITKDKKKINAIARVIKGIVEIKDDGFRTRQAILITGETGVGKTQLAENIAAAFGKEDRFIALNCATIRGADPNIQRIELFGCKKGAASGIAGDRDGALKKADGGVLFLDEIGELKPEMQAMLLTALDKGEFLPLGGDPSRPETSAFQLICGTNRDLEKLVEGADEGQSFRRDLFSRINTWHFKLDPLREHRDDIVDNLKMMVRQIGEKCGKVNFEIKKDAEDAFKEFAENDKTVTWDGNFRELNAMITRMVILSDDRIEKAIVEEEIKNARARYKAKHNAGAVAPSHVAGTGAPAENPPREATSHAARSILGDGVYDRLSPVDKAEIDCLLEIVAEEHVASQEELCQKAYGGRLGANGGLGRRLRKKFGLAFSRGRMERVGKAAT